MPEQPSNNPIVAGIGASIARTIVPVVVGTLLGAAAKHGFDFDNGSITEVVTVIITTLYYGIVRLLETHVAPAWGWLIGYAKVPAYPTVINTTAVDAAA